ncbi:MAG TPA: hypothetical protein VHO29_14355, partial [Marmoricola sp.]|nr:hypothetical protein [Marmoricola sp.]
MSDQLIADAPAAEALVEAESMRRWRRSQPAVRRPRQRPDRPRLVLATILTAQLMVVLDMSIVNVALPQMQTALGFSPTGLSWVLNAYSLAF